MTDGDFYFYSSHETAVSAICARSQPPYYVDVAVVCQGFRELAAERAQWRRDTAEVERLRTEVSILRNKAEFETMDPRSPPKFNGGVQCDMVTGPCACGAWHTDGK